MELKGKMELHEEDATPTNQVATDVGNIRNSEIEPTETSYSQNWCGNTRG
jgi:hypothetical protein